MPVAGASGTAGIALKCVLFQHGASGAGGASRGASGASGASRWRQSAPVAPVGASSEGWRQLAPDNLALAGQVDRLSASRASGPAAR